MTVTTKDVFVVSPPASVTDRVMTEVPALFCTGIIIRVRLDPLPPRLSPVGGMRDGLEEVTPTTNEPAAVSKSPIVNAIALFVLRYAIVMFCTAEIVGGLLVEGVGAGGVGAGGVGAGGVGAGGVGAGGVTIEAYSYAPMSTPAPDGRAWPSRSVDGAPVTVPRSMAALPSTR